MGLAELKPETGWSKRTFPRLWWHWLLVIVVAELMWFCALYPLVPKSVGAAVLEALLPLPLLGYLYLAALGLFWISARTWSVWTRRLLGSVIVLAAGAVGIWMIDWAVIHTPAEFSYFLIRRA